MAFVTRFLSDRTYVRTAVLDTTDDCVNKSQVLVHNSGRGFNVESSWIRGEKGEEKKGKVRISESRFTVSLIILIKKRSRLSVEFLC